MPDDKEDESNFAVECEHNGRVSWGGRGLKNAHSILDSIVAERLRACYIHELCKVKGDEEEEEA
jgi:hypothetical protein